MNDTLEYFKMHPYDRKRAYHKLTFSMMYFYSEHFLMPLSHDEVVHGKATIIQKMHGEYEDKFKQVRALYMYMYAHPGKKLNFMGNEIAQFREWDEKREQDWNILDYPIHNNFYKFMKKLNNIYLEYPALYKNDYEYSGFRWIDCHQEDKCIYVFERVCKEQRVIAIFNFSNEYHKDYELKVDSIKKMRLIIDSNSDDLEANEVIYIVRANNRSDKVKENKSEEEIENTILIDIPAFSARYYLVEK
ncbi:alpha amylase C-terminal domain-containing protein [Paraclostridium bifermentans]|uniref:alpha amylase C-terminal domain-containing protein n=1 Tax=Paraclostridium bifermentans TaxID=1490 RepID=UPI002FCD20B6